MHMLLVVVLAVLPTLAVAEQVISDDGREVQLKADGSWTFISEDRFATDANGKRLRLKADGTWLYSGEQVSLSGDRDTALISDSALRLRIEQLQIETKRVKKQKSSSKKTRSVFTVVLSLDKTAQQSLELSFNPADLVVDDTDGRQYSVISVQPETLTLMAGEEKKLTIVADGSPHWWTTKSMRLQFSPLALATDKAVMLTRSLSSAVKKEVADFK